MFRRTEPPTLRDFKMRRIRLRKGDHVVLETDLVFDREMAEALIKNAREAFAPAKVTLMSAGMKILVRRKKKTA